MDITDQLGPGFIVRTEKKLKRVDGIKSVGETSQSSILRQDGLLHDVSSFGNDTTYF